MNTHFLAICVINSVICNDSYSGDSDSVIVINFGDSDSVIFVNFRDSDSVIFINVGDSDSVIFIQFEDRVCVIYCFLVDLSNGHAKKENMEEV
jgi:hypothetical protein